MKNCQRCETPSYHSLDPASEICRGWGWGGVGESELRASLWPVCLGMDLHLEI